MSLLLMFSVSTFFIFSNAIGTTANNSSTAESCGENEVWYPCPHYCYFDDYCAKIIYGYFKNCPAPLPGWKCTGTCVCMPGFFRENGICSTLSVACCPVPNTEFVECNEYNCPKEKCVVRSSLPCKQNGCQCKAGFVYVNGTYSSLCPQPCSENEVCNSCPAHCSFDDTCNKLLLGIMPDCAAPPDDWQCSPKCVCKPGLVRENGTCTEPSSVCCSDPNAEFVQCPNPCPGGTCNQPDFAPCKMACKQYGCQCKQGFVKDKEGKCILLDQCPSCGANAHFDCGPPIDKNCTNVELDLSIYEDCVERCYCDDGYARNDRNICIPIADCKTKSCGVNEVWKQCPNYCTLDDTCFGYLTGRRPVCRPPPGWQCTGRCYCDAGFVRMNGKCVRPESCCTNPNTELVKCPNPCPGGTCAQPSYTPCDTSCQPYGCECKTGFLKDSNGTCVPSSQCPKKCSTNEAWNPCVPYCTFDMTCDRLIDGMTPDCAPKPADWKCSGACQCAEGYVRTDGMCVEKSACCPNPNTELVSCPNPCPGGTCEQRAYLPCNKTCKEWGCQCKKGHFLNNKSECVPEENCQPKCGENERYIPCRADCSGFYYYTCSLLLNGIRVNCPRPIPGKCSEFCECTYTSNGTPYVRINGKCRHPNECCTNPNTEMAQCVNRCPGGTCQQPNYTRCSTPCAPYGCRCKNGFVLDSKGICIPLEQCPKTSTTT